MMLPVILCFRTSKTMHLSQSSLSFGTVFLCLLGLTHSYTGDYEDYRDYLLPETGGYYPLDKRSYDPHCSRCSSSGQDWLSCYKCWSRPGRSVPYYSKIKRSGIPSDDDLVATEEILRDLLLVEEELESERKNVAVSKCACCLKYGDPVCCTDCASFIDSTSKKTPEKRSFDGFGNFGSYASPIAEYGSSWACSCCNRDPRNFCCVACAKRR